MDISGICGWFGATPLQDNARTLIKRMAVHTNLSIDRATTIAVNRYAFAGLRSSCFTHESGVVAIISGLPRWRDAALHAHSCQHGNASTIAKAYKMYGAEFVSKLGGTFSSVVVDPDNDTLLLTIDHFGIERLCYSVAEDRSLVFGSTIDSVCCYPSIERNIDNQAIFDYLYFHMIPSPRTIYCGVHKLEPGQCLIFRQGQISNREHSRQRFVDTGNQASDLPKAIIDKLRDSIRNCIPDQTTEIGAFLSGGLDSSTVCGLLSEVSGTATKAYSIGFSQEGYDEMEYARIAARHFGLELHEHYVTHDEVAESIPLIANSYDEPFGNSSAVPALLCAKMAKEDGVYLLLAGDGGDEIFAGNERYARQKLFSYYDKIPQSMRRALIEPIFLRSRLGGLNSLTRKFRSYIQQAKIPLPQRLQTYNILCRNEMAEVFDPGFLESVDTNNPALEYERIWREAPTDSMLNRMLYLDWKFTLADNDIRKVNRMCQLAGISVAYPMLDDEIVNLSLTIPPSQKLKRLRLRHFFKAAVTNLLPIEIINKSKHGFGLPFGEWLRESPRLREITDDSLKRIRTRHIIKPEFVDRLTALHREDHASYYGEMVWVLIMLEQWLTHHDH